MSANKFVVRISNMPLEPVGLWYAGVVVSKLYDDTNMQTKLTHNTNTFLVFPSMKFCESLSTSWYRCLLHNIIFSQNFIERFLFFNQKNCNKIACMTRNDYQLCLKKIKYIYKRLLLLSLLEVHSPKNRTVWQLIS